MSSKYTRCPCLTWRDILKGHFPLIAANTVGRSYAMIGQLTQGLGMLDTIRDLCLQKGNLYVAASAGSSIAMTLLSINRLEDAFRYLKSSLVEAKQSGNYWVKLIVMFMLALAHFRKGNKKQSLEYLRRFLQNSREVHVSLTSFIPISWKFAGQWKIKTFPRFPIFLWRKRSIEC